MPRKRTAGNRGYASGAGSPWEPISSAGGQGQDRPVPLWQFCQQAVLRRGPSASGVSGSPNSPIGYLTAISIPQGAVTHLLARVRRSQGAFLLKSVGTER